jgi:hypothetical protein
MFRSTPDYHTMYRPNQGKIKGPIHHFVASNPRENVQCLDGVLHVANTPIILNGGTLVPSEPSSMHST